MQVEEVIQIKNRLGLHARPAALMVQTASRYSSRIELEVEGTRVNGKSIMGVMMLAAAYGSKMMIIAEGDDAQESVNAIKALIDSKFDEE